MRRNRFLPGALRVAAGSTVVLVLVRALGDQAGDVRLLTSLSGTTILSLFLLPLLNLGVMAFAQEMVVRAFGVRLRWREILGLQILQRVGNLLLPGGGAAARVLYLKRRHDLPWPALSSLLLGTTVVFLFALGTALSVGILGLSLTGQAPRASFLPAALVLLCLTLAPIGFPPRIAAGTRAQPWRFLAEVVNGWHAIARNRPLVLKVAALRALALAPPCLIYGLCLRDMGSPAGFFPILFLVSLTQLAGWIPISPDGIGVTESTLVLGAGLLGLDLGHAFALAVALRSGQLAATVLVLLPASLLARRPKGASAPGTGIVLASHAGTNLGDNLLGEVLEREVRRRFPASSVRHFTINPLRTRFPALRSLYPVQMTWPANFFSYCRHLMSAKLLLGFWALQDHGSYGFTARNLAPRFFHFFALPGLFRVPVAFINVESAFLSTALGRKIAARVFAGSGLVVFRNRRSAARAEEIRPGTRRHPVASDIGFLYRPIQEPRETPSTAPLVVNLRPVPLGERAWSSLHGAILEASTALAGPEVVFLGMHPEDRAPFLRLRERFPEPCRHWKFVLPEEPAGAWELVLGSRAVIAARFHLQILALLAGRPVFLLGYAAKSADLADEIGLEDSYSDMGDHTGLERKLAFFAHTVRDGLWRHPTEAVARAERRARNSFDILESFVRELPL